MLRSFLAVVLGYVAMGIGVMLATVVAVRLLLGEPGPDLAPTRAYLAVNVAYSTFFAVFGGYVAARIGARAPLAHGLALGGAVLLLGVVSLIVMSGREDLAARQPPWYPYTIIATGFAGAVTGGWLRARQTGGV